MRWPDWLLLAACAGLLVIGPAMSIQEITRAEDLRARAELTGIQDKPDYSFREAWRIPLFVLVIVVGVLGSILAVRTLRNRRMRAVTGRLVSLLLTGMTILDIAYLFDSRSFATAPFALRTVLAVAAYPIAGFLIAGVTYRLADVERVFGKELPNRPDRS